MNPIFASSGSSTRRIKSAGGAEGYRYRRSLQHAKVHRQTTARQHSLQHQRTTSGATDSKAVSPPRTVPGRKSRRCDPSSAPPPLPYKFPQPLLPRSDAGAEPRFRPSGSNASDGKWLAGYIDRLSAERRICPPPSPCAPSAQSSFSSFILLRTPPDAGCNNFHQIALCRHHRINIFIRHGISSITSASLRHSTCAVARIDLPR